MKSRVWFALAVAGATAAASLGASAAPSRGLKFHVVQLGASAKGGTEPTIAIDTHNRIFVSPIHGLGNMNYMGTPVWRSDDGGKTFRSFATAHAGPSGTPLGGGDSAVITDKRDYVYATDLWVGDDSIALSKDHGATWTGSPVSHRMGSDRNWLAYATKDDALYQIYNGVDALYVSRADLGVAGPEAALVPTYTFRVAGETAGVPGQYTRNSTAWPGGIAVDQREGAVYATWSDQDGVAVARSADKGLTWTIGHIPHSSTTGSWNDSAWNYAPVGVDSHGNVFVMWCQSVGQPGAPNGIKAYLAVSRDNGKNWHTTTVKTQRTAVFPTMAVLGVDRVAMVWIDSPDTGNPNKGTDFSDSSWRLGYGEVSGLAAGRPHSEYATIESLVHDGTVFVGPQGGDRGMGDFVSMAVGPSGLLAVTYTRAVDRASWPRVATIKR